MTGVQTCALPILLNHDRDPSALSQRGQGFVELAVFLLEGLELVLHLEEGLGNALEACRGMIHSWSFPGPGTAGEGALTRRAECPRRILQIKTCGFQASNTSWLCSAAAHLFAAPSRCPSLACFLLKVTPYRIGRTRSPLASQVRLQQERMKQAREGRCRKEVI